MKKIEKIVIIYVPVIEFATDLSLFATCVAAQELAVQVRTGFHTLSESHTVVPEPVHPSLHVTIMLVSITPETEPVAALSLFSTCVGRHTGRHVDAVPAAAAKERAYPVLHALQSN